MSDAKSMALGEKLEALRCLGKIARYARKAIEDAARGETIVDIGEHKGHDESAIDRDAQGAILQLLHRHYPRFRGVVAFEDDRYEHIGEANGGTTERFLIIDEIDGTTNFKRVLASPFTFPVSASISIALGTSDRLGDVEVSIVYALDTGEVFGAVRADDGSYLAFVNDRIIYPEDVIPMRGDSNARILVPGYSFKVRGYKAAIEEALIAGGLKRVYEGSRSSSMDIIGVVRGLNDAYVDVRARFGDEERYGAMLQGYDVAGAIPVALGAGLAVRAFGARPWQEYRNTDRLALGVGRPEILAHALEAVSCAPSPEEFLASRGRTAGAAVRDGGA